ADDQHDRVPRLLELREPIEDEREAEMDVRRGWVDPELDAQWAAGLQLALELALGQDIDGVPRQVRWQRGRDSRSRSARPHRWGRSRTPARGTTRAPRARASDSRPSGSRDLRPRSRCMREGCRAA